MVGRVAGYDRADRSLHRRGRVERLIQRVPHELRRPDHADVFPACYFAEACCPRPSLSSTKDVPEPGLNHVPSAAHDKVPRLEVVVGEFFLLQELLRRLSEVVHRVHAAADVKVALHLDRVSAFRPYESKSY